MPGLNNKTEQHEIISVNRMWVSAFLRGEKKKKKKSHIYFELFLRYTGIKSFKQIEKILFSATLPMTKSQTKQISISFMGIQKDSGERGFDL